MSRKSRLISSLLTGFAVAFFFALVLPVQTYLANADSFNYTLGALLGDLCLSLVLTFAVASLALFFLSRWIGQFLHILMLALVVAAFAESGPLSIGLPELNGDFSGYKSLTRAIWDWSILLGIVFIPLCCYCWLRRSTTWIALALVVYLGATLFDVKVKSQRPEGMEDFIVPHLVPRADVVRSVEFSPKRNVIMLILDSISVDACVDAFAADPDLASRFTGFVNYTNNVGMMWPTNMAIPGIFTGRYCETLGDLSKHGQSLWMKDSFIKPYLDKNIPVYVNVVLTKDGYTNRLKPPGDESVLKKCSPMEERMLGLYPMKLPELVQFRTLPYFAKEMYVSGLSFPTNSSSGQALDVNRLFDDAYLWQVLAKKPVNPDLEMTLHVHHVKGSHLPIRHKRDGRAAKKGDMSYAGYVDESIYAFRQVAQLLDAWKTNGVYDASTIFVIADHATALKPSHARKDVSSAMFPFLMVKPMHSSGPIVCSDIATTHSNISKIVLRMADSDALRQDFDAGLHAVLRRSVDLTAKKTEWCFDEHGIMTKRVSGVDNFLLTPLELDKINNFCVCRDEVFCNYHVKRGWRGSVIGTRGEDMLFEFKVPKPEMAYDFRFWITPTPMAASGIVSVQIDEEKVAAFYNSKSLLQTLLLENVKSKPNGIVEVKIRRESGAGVLGLSAMKVCKHVDDVLAVDGSTLFAGDVEIFANANMLGSRLLSDKLAPAKTYGLQIEEGRATEGNLPRVCARILAPTGEIVDFTCFELKCNALAKCSRRFTTPKKPADYRCFIYAGDYDSAGSARVMLKNVRLVEMDR